MQINSTLDNSNSIISATKDVGWILGSVNIDEHPLFSELYIGTSQDKITTSSHLKYPGYSQILAIYENGVERYYVPMDEAQKTSEWLIKHFLDNPSDIQQNLDNIVKYSQDLVNAFPEDVDFSKMSREELLDSLRKHNEMHAQLYEYARIPEALDRGLPFFTNYLKDYLREVGVSETDLPQVFNDLTKPKNPSIFLEEKTAFNKIVGNFHHVIGDLAESQRTSMFLPSELLRALKDHREKYKWLDYHGYRSPDLPSIQPSVNRFFTEAERTEKNLLSSTILSSPTGRNLLNPEHIQQPEITSPSLENSPYEHLIDENHKALFDAYTEISRVKVVRRFAQLRNFYYYDKLLEACADKLNVPEIDVRCCLSEELEKALATGHLDSKKRNRVKDKFVILYDGEGKHVLGSEESKSLLENVTLTEDIDFQHSTIYPGFAKGIARHIVDKNSKNSTG